MAGEAELFTAVKEGDAAKVEALLEAGADVGVMEWDSDRMLSPLFYALDAGNVEVARILLEAGALEHPCWDPPGYMVHRHTALGHNA